MRRIKRICIAMCLLMIVLSGCKSSILDDPSTSISFSVPQQAHVTLRVENSYNTVMATLVDQVMSPGAYSTSFREDNLAEGVYFYTLEIKGTGNSSYSTQERYFLLEK